MEGEEELLELPPAVVVDSLEDMQRFKSGSEIAV